MMIKQVWRKQEIKWERGRKGEARTRQRAVIMDGDHTATAEMRLFVWRRGRERQRQGCTLSAVGAGSQPDSVWGCLSNSRIHHTDCRPCYWWRHKSEQESKAATSAMFASENPWHLGIIYQVLLCCVLSVCVHTIHTVLYVLYIYDTAHAHYAPSHPAIRYITHDFNTTNHCFLFCLTRERN